MASLIYAPEATVRIETSKNSTGKGAIVDVSDDCSGGSVTRIAQGGVSTASVTLLNQGRKYDGMFNPMDKIVIYLRRVKSPMLKFSGYLDTVPKWSAVPGSVNLAASCTLKRLVNFEWDPGSDAAVGLLGRIDPNAATAEDGGTTQKAIDVLTEVANWTPDTIHISQVPHAWYLKIASLADSLIADAEALRMSSTSGTGAWIGGSNPIGKTTSQIPGAGPGTGTMPATVGKCSYFGGPNGGAYGNFALTGEPGTHPNDQWYCAMRWGYVSDQGRTIPGVNIGQAKAWWANRKIMVVNTKNNKAVVVRAADWGPNIDTGRVIDLAPGALAALGANTNDVLHMGFAPDGVSLGLQSTANAALGDLLSNKAGVGTTSGAGAANAATVTVGAGGSSSGAHAITSGWGTSGDASNMVWVKAAGISFQVNKIAQKNFVGFVNDLVSTLGYHPKTIGGYRPSGGIGGAENHGYGAAIDIDAATNKYYYSAAGGSYTLPRPPAIIDLARKWGLGWGGEFRNSKDYMHFEVIGAPWSTAASYKGAKTGGSGPTVLAKWTPPIHGAYTITMHFRAADRYSASGVHSGTDFACPSGTAIYAVGPGVVHQSSYSAADYGNWISIDHGGGVYTQYAHMNALSPLAVGTHVDQNTVIGHVGTTGNTTGPHVHVEFRKGADNYNAALASGGIEKYVIGGSGRSDPPSGTESVTGSFSTADATAGANSTGTSGGDIGKGLFNVFEFQNNAATELGTTLGGYRALMNDVPVLDTISQCMSAAMRDYCSAPNGDFIAWFPDYFGHYGQAGKMVVSPLEIDLVNGPPTIGQSDVNLKTHQFVSGASGWYENDASQVQQQDSTSGIASIEFPAIMQALFNISAAEAADLATQYLSKMGARHVFTPMNNISGGRQEFFFACHLFMQNWAQQYQAEINLTFMPELFPGMLLCLPIYGVQGYVVQTTDSWSLTDGSGFKTSVVCAPWSSLGKESVIDGLPVGASL